MHKTVWMTGIAVAAMMLIGWAGEEPENLIKDPSFEAPPGEKIPGWYVWKPDDSKHLATVSAEAAHTGKQSLKVTGTGRFVTVNGPWLKVTDDSRFLLSGYVKVVAEQKGWAEIKIAYNDAKDGWAGNTFCGKAIPGDDWKLLAAISRPEGLKDVRTMNPLLSFCEDGTCYFDDISLTRIPAKADQAELLANSDMEVVVGEQVVELWANAPPEGPARIAPETKDVAAGKYSLKLTGKGPWGSVNSEMITIDPQKNYEARVSVKVPKGKAHLQIGYFDNGNWLGGTESEDTTAGDWLELSLKAEMKKFPKITGLAVAVVGNGTDFEVLVDNLSLKEVPAK